MTYTHQQNHRVTGLDLAFAGSLHQNNCGEGYWDSGWQVVEHQADRTVVVQKNHLTVHTNPDRHLRNGPWTLGDRVDLKLPKNLVDGDRYVAVGNAGVPGNDRVALAIECATDQVAGLIQQITQELNQLNLPFTLGCFYDPLDYPDPEAAILTMNATDQLRLSELQKRFNLGNT
jgi:HopA1 effector protein family